MSQSNKSARPKKPYPAFPLTAHPTGKWCKCIRGRLHYFGAWATRVNGKLTRVAGDGWEAALEEYKAQADDLHAGRTPRTKTNELTVAGLCNRFLDLKLSQVETGELSPLTLKEYKLTTDQLITVFGGSRLVIDLATEDFEKLRSHLAAKWGPVRLGNQIERTRAIFRYAHESDLIDRPIRYGPQFKKPTRAVMRRHRATRGPRMFDAGEIRLMLENASLPLRAMILLAINCAFGNSDIAGLPLSVVDLKNGWINFPRPKTGVSRRCPIWTETAEAIREVLRERPEPRDSADLDLIFITKYRRRWIRATEKKSSTNIRHYVPMDSIALEFGKLLVRLKLNGRRGLGFYGLRHTFRTIADSCLDFPAVRLIMGHADDSIDAVYREYINDDRLVAVSEQVRQWLFKDASVTARTDAPRIKVLAM